MTTGPATLSICCWVGYENLITPQIKFKNKPSSALMYIKSTCAPLRSPTAKLTPLSRKKLDWEEQEEPRALRTAADFLSSRPACNL